MHVQAHIKYVLTSAPRAQFHCDLGKQMVFDTVALANYTVGSRSLHILVYIAWRGHS